MSYNVRKANQSDVEFLAKAIISAEGSGSERVGLAKFFGLDTIMLKSLIVKMLLEEVDGCEFSISSFLLLEHHSQPVAAVGGWIEEFNGELNSRTLKSNLIGFIFPKPNIQYAQNFAHLAAGIQLPREQNTLQIEYVFVDEGHRKRHLADRLIQEHIQNALGIFPGLGKVQVQLFSNNLPAVRLYERNGFTIAGRAQSLDGEILNFVPHHEKIVMEKNI